MGKGIDPIIGVTQVVIFLHLGVIVGQVRLIGLNLRVGILRCGNRQGQAQFELGVLGGMAHE